uniref:Putative mannosyltransferase n=1 Tax=Paracoccidioides brasiliensis TaxID=121759 RepID=Q96WZ3_PARBR|nr:putative mannosyltransferase [Paracoccidioides brasiliensis]
MFSFLQSTLNVISIALITSAYLPPTLSCQQNPGRRRNKMLPRQPSMFKLFTLISLILVGTISIFSYKNRTALTSRNVTSFKNFLSSPSTSSKPIPEKIWYKLGAKGISPKIQEWTATCISKNPTYVTEFLTDDSADEYVKIHFSHRPDIVDTYLSLPIPILKADMLRYLLLIAEGGVWNDLDITCGDIPIRDWIPEQFKKDANLVVGWEFDVGWGESFIRQFTSWTIMARPGSKHLEMVVHDILDAIDKTKKKHKLPKTTGLQLQMLGDIVDYTGPRRLTRSIFKSLSEDLGGEVNAGNASNLLSPKLLGDVLILPGFSFASSTNKYEGVKGPDGKDFVPGQGASSKVLVKTWAGKV